MDWACTLGGNIAFLVHVDCDCTDHILMDFIDCIKKQLVDLISLNLRSEAISFLKVWGVVVTKTTVQVHIHGKDKSRN